MKNCPSCLDRGLRYNGGMNTYLILLRGINVGGKNKVSMAELKKCLEERGFENVATYIASGNVIVDSKKSAAAVKDEVEKFLPECFKLDSELIKVLVLSEKQLEAVVKNRPKGFGGEPEKYYSDAVFLMGIGIKEAMPIFTPREGVDMVWPGEGVVYSQRLGAERTKSRLGRITLSPLYKSLTIRSWNTTTKLLALMQARGK
jgi:uncharacterized protein (DUF1697 family)